MDNQVIGMIIALAKAISIKYEAVGIADIRQGTTPNTIVFVLVNGDTHTVTISYSASGVAFTPVGKITSTNVQSAIAELLDIVNNKISNDTTANEEWFEEYPSVDGIYLENIRDESYTTYSTYITFLRNLISSSTKSREELFIPYNVGIRALLYYIDTANNLYFIVYKNGEMIKLYVDDNQIIRFEKTRFDEFLTPNNYPKMQYSLLPTPSASIVGDIYQYIGTTDSDYTNGYFYEVVEVTEDDEVTYSYARKDVQPTSQSVITVSDYVLDKDSWNNNTYTLQIAGKVAGSNVRLSDSQSWIGATDEDVLFNRSQISKTNIYRVVDGSSSNTIVLTCESVPSYDLHITVEVF